MLAFPTGRWLICQTHLCVFKGMKRADVTQFGLTTREGGTKPGSNSRHILLPKVGIFPRVHSSNLFPTGLGCGGRQHIEFSLSAHQALIKRVAAAKSILFFSHYTTVCSLSVPVKTHFTLQYLDRIQVFICNLLNISQAAQTHESFSQITFLFIQTQQSSLT